MPSFRIDYVNTSPPAGNNINVNPWIQGISFGYDVVLKKMSVLNCYIIQTTGIHRTVDLVFLQFTVGNGNIATNPNYTTIATSSSLELQQVRIANAPNNGIIQYQFPPETIFTSSMVARFNFGIYSNGIVATDVVYMTGELEWERIKNVGL